MSGPKVDYAKLREQEMASLAEARGRRLKGADKIQNWSDRISVKAGFCRCAIGTFARGGG